MKRISLLLMAMLIWQVSVSAYENGFEVNGIYYSVKSKNATEASVVGFNPNPLPNAVTISETVTYSWYDGPVRTYKVTSVGNNAFHRCQEITSITIPNSVRSIGYGAFYECERLTSVVLPEGITSIGYDTFSGCISLTSITIPSSVTSIGGNAFSNCTSLKNISIPAKVRSIGFGAFCGCKRLTSIIIPEGVVILEGSTFSDCEKLTSITFPKSLKTIGDDAFWGCGFNEIEVPEGVESIGERVFCRCRNMTKVILPKSLKAIGELAFAELPFLTTIVSNIEEPFDIGYPPIVFAGDNDEMGKRNITIFIPANTLNKYKMVQGWNYLDDNTNRQTTLVEFDSEDFTAANNVVYTYSPHATKAYVKSGTYDLKSRKATIASPLAGSDVVIPGILNINGKSYTVSSIGSYALAGPSPISELEGQVRRLTLPETIEFVDLYALYGRMETVVCLSPTPPAVYNPKSSDNFGGSMKKTTLRVPKECGDSYREAPGWNEFDHISEIGSDALANVDPVESEMEVKPRSLSNQNLIDHVINSVYYNLGSDTNPYYYININKPTDMSKIVDATPGSDDIWRYFTGIILKVRKGKGTIRVSVKTSGNLQFVTQVGNQNPVIVSKAERDDVVVDYDVTGNTYVYIYAIEGGNNARITRSEADTNNMVYIYGITITPNTTGISTVQNSTTSPFRCYSLDGREMQNLPTKPGIYIVNGQKNILPSIH